MNEEFLFIMTFELNISYKIFTKNKYLVGLGGS